MDSYCRNQYPKMGQIQKGSCQNPSPAAAGAGLDQRVNKKQIYYLLHETTVLGFERHQGATWHKRMLQKWQNTQGCLWDYSKFLQNLKDYYFFSEFQTHVNLPRVCQRSFAKEAQSEADGNMISFPFLSQWSAFHSCRQNLNFSREMKSMEVSGTFPLCYLWKRQTLGLYSRNMITFSSGQREIWY